MQSIHSPQTKNTAMIAMVLICCIFSFSGCAYRLTNLHIQNPGDIQTIAIESVFDTGGQVIPHEHLWDQLQRAFAANGHLKLAPASSADALVRAHIRLATVENAGGLTDTPADVLYAKKDPDIYAGQSQPWALTGPASLRDLTTASKYYSKDATTFTVDIEVWNLETHGLMLQRTYTGRSEAWAIVGQTVDRKAINPYLQDMILPRHDETQDRNMASVAKQIAENVVTDLLVR